MILNESAVKLVGMKQDIVGQTIQFNDKNYTVIGVIKDMIMESPYKPVTPTVFLYDPQLGKRYNSCHKTWCTCKNCFK